MITYVDIDLSDLKPYMGRMMTGVNAEYIVIHFYKMITTSDHNTVELVNNYICNHIYRTQGKKYTYDDLIAVVNERQYISYLYKFIFLLESTLFKEVGPNILDAKYNKVIDKENLIVQFIITMRDE